MQINHFYWAGKRGFVLDKEQSFNPDLVLYFFDKSLNNNICCYSAVRELYPEAHLVGCSTSGPILEDDVYQGSITGAAIKFDKSQFKLLEAPCPNPEKSFQVGVDIVKQLNQEGLQHIFMITDGISVNGHQLVEGINSVLPKSVTVSGGLASDCFEFSETLTGIDREPDIGNICLIAFYGEDIAISTSADGGWVEFGKEFIISKSEGSKLYELDNESALDIYKDYLGPDADQLPASGLYFPLAIKYGDGDHSYVRTVNAVDEKEKSLNFTGDIPVGKRAQFLKGSFENLSQGALRSAEVANDKISENPQLVIAISCLGRQLLMGQKIGDELEAVKSVFSGTPVVGFYSNGELSSDHEKQSQLHNQTMTITVLGEK